MKTHSPRSKIMISIALLFLVWSGLSPAMAAAPTLEIESTVTQVIKILTDPALRGRNQQVERRMLLRNAIAPRFDFREMAKSSLGPYWHHLTGAQQDEFVQLFTRLLEKAYLSRIESYHDEKFVYTGETMDQRYAEVDSKIVTAQNNPYPIDYLLHRIGNDWKIYDVVIEGVSLVDNYRSQFDHVIYRYSYGELVRRMKQRLSQENSRG